MIRKTSIVPYLRLSASDLSFSFPHSLYVTILVASSCSTQSRGQQPLCQPVMVLREYGELVFPHFFPVKPGRLLSFWVTETPRAGVFRQQSVATVIPLSESSSQRHLGFFLPGPGLALACPGAHMPTAVRSHSPSGSGSLSPYLGGHFHLPRDPPII